MWSSGLQIRIVEGRSKGRVCSLDRPHIKLGRAFESGVRAEGWLLLDDDTVSRFHAELAWNEQDQFFTIINRSETNQTLVNGEAVLQKDIQVGDQIRLGTCVLTLQQVDIQMAVVKPTLGSRIKELPPAEKPEPRRALQLEKSSPGSGSRKTGSGALKARPNFWLEVMAGPDSGQRFPISGSEVILGGPSPINIGASAGFSQEIVLNDATLPPRCLLLCWTESLQGFKVSRPDNGDVMINLERHSDGLLWAALLPLDQSCVVRSDDLIRMGRNRIKISLVSGADSKKKRESRRVDKNLISPVLDVVRRSRTDLENPTAP